MADDHKDYPIDYTGPMPDGGYMIKLLDKQRLAVLGADELIKLSGQGLDIIYKIGTTKQGENVVLTTKETAALIGACSGLSLKDLLDAGYGMTGIIQIAGQILDNSVFFTNLKTAETQPRTVSDS